jgi:hypothetical protein
MKVGRKGGSRKVRVGRSGGRNTRRVGGKVSRRRSGGFGPEPTSPQPHLIGDL